MWRRSSISGMLLMLMSVSACAAAQDLQHEAFLRDRGLTDVYAEYLLDRLEGASGEERRVIAQRLAAVYLELLQDLSPGVDRQQWAERAATLLRAVPEADTPGLRLGLAQAAYLKAEESAERHVLLLASEQEVADAQRILREVGPTFVQIAQEAHQNALRLEREVTKDLGREEEDAVAEQLAESRRNRSVAFYFAGWSSYYTAELSGQRAHAEEALRHFGWILGTRDGAPATVDQLQPSLLQFEHVARSAVGAAMACSFTGRSLEARAWLDAVSRSTDVAPAIRDSLDARRVRVFADAGAWPDVDTIARRAFASQNPPADATFIRLIAILALDQREPPNNRHSQLISRLADAAVSQLVRIGEIGHVTDLARRYGDDMLGTDGFIPEYVRAVMQRETAQRLAETHGDDDPRTVNALIDAAERLASASSASDAERFPSERSQAIFQAGQSLFEAGLLTEAGELFEQCQALATTEDQRRMAAWMRVVTLEKAVELGDSASGAERDQAALLYLAAYPASDEAAQLALRPNTARLLTEGQAIDILLSVPSSAPTYATARRRAAALLYRKCRIANQIEAPLIAEQFMGLAEDLITQDAAVMRSLDPSEALPTAEAILLNARRLADIALSVTPKQIERAMYAIDAIGRTAAYASIDISELEHEMMFRRLQIASDQGDVASAADLAEQLTATDNPFRDTAARVLYRDAVRAWIDDQSNPEIAQRVMRAGLEIQNSLSDQPAALTSVLTTVAQAADFLSTHSEDDSEIRVAVDARERIVEMGLADQPTLRSLALGYAALGNDEQAAETWLTVLQGAENGTLPWYEARLRSLVHLEYVDPEAARDAASQFRALHPDNGPPKYREQFVEVLTRLLGSEAG